MPKILVISMRIPYPLLSGYQVTMFNYLNALSKMGFDIHLMCVKDGKHAKDNENLESLRTRIPAITRIDSVYIPLPIRILGSLFGFLVGLPLQIGYFSNFYTRRRVAAFIQSTKYDEYLLHTVRLINIVPKDLWSKSVVFFADSLAMNYYSALESTSGLKKLSFVIEAPRMKKYEKKMSLLIKAAIFHNTIDVEFLNLRSKTHIIPILKPIVKPVRPITTETRKRFLFIGQLSYLPNLLAVNSLVETFRDKKNLDYKIDFIGTGLPNNIIEQLKDIPHMNYLGAVDDLTTEIQDSYGILSPMQIGAGMTNKILDAIVNNRPSIASDYTAQPYEKFLSSETNGKININNSGILKFSTPHEMVGLMHRLISDLEFANKTVAMSASAAEYFDIDRLTTYFKDVFEGTFVEKSIDKNQAITLKSVLFITQYFPPEIGGGAQRSSGIAEGLQKFGVDVTVIAPFPTYMLRDHERATSWKFWEEQKIGQVRVLRSFVIAPDRNDILKRILYYLSFAVSALVNGIIHTGKVDAIIVISPPLLTGITGVFLKMVKRTKLIFDVGDIWPESAIQLGFIKNRPAIKVLEWQEKWIYKHSDAVNLVTRNTYNRFLKIHQDIKNTFYVPNFVDTKLITKTSKNEELLTAYGLSGKIVFGYAGNIGSAQGITVITDAATRLKGRKEIVFLIIGDGIEVAKLETEIRINELDNVVFVPPIPKEDIKQYLSLFDYTIIPLVKSDLFKITIPSKMYECMAAEIPVILCVDGEARRVLEEAGAGLFVEPGNGAMLADTVSAAADSLIDGVRMGKKGREYSKKHFDRDEVVADLIKKLETIQ